MDPADPRFRRLSFWIAANIWLNGALALAATLFTALIMAHLTVPILRVLPEGFRKTAGPEGFATGMILGVLVLAPAVAGLLVAVPSFIFWWGNRLLARRVKRAGRLGLAGYLVCGAASLWMAGIWAGLALIAAKVYLPR